MTTANWMGWMPYWAATGIRMGATMMVADRVSMNMPTKSRKITSRIMMTYLLEVRDTRKFTMMVGSFT